MLTDAGRAQIRERVEATTAGPWILASGGAPDEEQPYALWGGGYLHRGIVIAWDNEYWRKFKMADAHFIAAAREDVLALLADGDELRAENERLHEALAEMTTKVRGLQFQSDMIEDFFEDGYR